MTSQGGAGGSAYGALEGGAPSGSAAARVDPTSAGASAPGGGGGKRHAAGPASPKKPMGRRVRPAAGPTEIKNKTQLGSFVHAPAGTRIRVSLLGRGPVEGLMFASSRAAVAANAMSEDDTLILHGEKPIWLFEGQPRVVTTGYSNPITVLGAAASPVDAAAMGAAGAASLRAALGERGIGGGGGGGPRRLDLAPVPPVRGGEGGGRGPLASRAAAAGVGHAFSTPRPRPSRAAARGGGRGPLASRAVAAAAAAAVHAFSTPGPCPRPPRKARGGARSRAAARVTEAARHRGGPPTAAPRVLRAPLNTSCTRRPQVFTRVAFVR